MREKRVTLFAGHYGSGKTNIAVNYALFLREKAMAVAIADLDIVNPYFRTKDSEKILRENGIRLVVSAYANTNVDIPALPGEIYAVLGDKSSRVVLDVGGDDRGALALGRYTPQILEENDYEMCFVVNRYRPLTRTPAEAEDVRLEIERAGGLPFTSIVNNSNLGWDTEPEHVLDSLEYAREVSRLSGLPILMTTVEKRLYPCLLDRVEGLFPLSLQVKYFDIDGGK